MGPKPLKKYLLILELSTHFVFVCIVNKETHEKPKKIQKEIEQKELYC